MLTCLKEHYVAMSRVYVGDWGSLFFLTDVMRALNRSAVWMKACAKLGHVPSRQSLGSKEGGIGPAVELCDGIDTDCDGQLDNGDLCPEGQRCGGPLGCIVGECENTAIRPCGTNEGTCRRGTETCENNRWGACIGLVGPVDEVCDGLDNDCDGQVDNGELCGDPNGFVCAGEVAALPSFAMMERNARAA